MISLWQHNTQHEYPLLWGEPFPLFSLLQYVGQRTMWHYFRTLSFAKHWQIALQCEPDFSKWLPGIFRYFIQLLSSGTIVLVMKDKTIHCVYLGLFSFWNEVSSEHTRCWCHTQLHEAKVCMWNVEECTQMAQLHLLIA